MFATTRTFTTSDQFKKDCALYPNTSGVIVLTRDLDSVGTVSLMNGEAHVDWTLGNLDSKALTVGLESGCRVLLAAGFQKVNLRREACVYLPRARLGI